MNYHAAPPWDDDKCPFVDPKAAPREVEFIAGRRAIDVIGAYYREAIFSGTFILSDHVALPLPSEGKHRVRVECCWHGHRLKTDEPHFLIDMATAVVHEDYAGPVSTDLGK